MSKKTVVIVGGSFAGLQVAHGLLKASPGQVKVVLINPSDKWYFNVAAPRIFAKPNAFRPDQYLMPIEKAFARYPQGSFEFIKGTATALDTGAKEVKLSSSAVSSVRYDYLVIASGSSAAALSQGAHAPFKPTGSDSLEGAIRAAQQSFSDARTVIIGGAGPLGVELAGELAEAWASRSGTSITLVTATPHVLPMLKPGAGATAEKLLRKHSVKLVRSRKVVEAVQDEGDRRKPWIVTLDNGEKLKADLYVSTVGVVPNNEFIPAEFLSPEGWVKVDEHFRVKGSDRQPIYAVGDITVHPIRTAMKVAEQIPVVVANLKADIIGSGKHPAYAANEKIMMLVPIGASTGTGQMMGWIPWGKMVSMFKGKDFLVSRAASMVGF